MVVTGRLNRSEADHVVVQLHIDVNRRTLDWNTERLGESESLVELSQSFDIVAEQHDLWVPEHTQKVQNALLEPHREVGRLVQMEVSELPITVMNHMTLDGVMQAPGRQDEDTRGGFAHGGWAEAGNDEVMGDYLGSRMASGRGGALLFGRRTYEDLLSFWNSQPDSPFAPVLNSSPKYVASTTLSEPLPWPNSTLLVENPVEAVADLKRDQPDTGFKIMGSSTLIHQLMAHSLIDEWLLMIHPLVLGSGIKLFPDHATPTRLVMVDSVTTTTGVILATYRTAG